MGFNHKEIEKKWQLFWKEKDIFKTNLDSDKKKFYGLDMFPYPSGAGLHVGHPEGYTATDILCRMKKMQSYEVLHPMGWDAFGLPAEQYAIKTGNSPKEFTLKNIEIFKEQLNSLGFSFDWSREINTSNPKYFKYTQWIFAQLYKKGLAEIKEINANWSPSLNTVLSNEEVVKDENGNYVSERDNKPVEKRKMKQWVLKITQYADKLFNGLEKLDWPDSIKRLQKNWIYYQDENGNYTNTLHLNDWTFARQRYWGEPFPIIHLENGEIYLIPESEYPILLPEIGDYSFSKDGKPALSKAIDWSEVEINGIKGVRDLNTMPQWAGSCWYYIGYILKEENEFLDLNSEKAKKRLDKWLPVDIYIGGQEHAVLHLIYARFWHIFLNEIGITNVKEPFKKLFNQGMILGPDGLKMSKSKGNVINPNDIVEQYGADTLRIYEMFMGALDDDKPWSEDGLNGSKNWLNRVYRFFIEFANYNNEVSNNIKFNYNKLIDEVTLLFEELKFNVAISKMMVFINELYKDPNISKNMSKGFLQILSCVAPHISDEIYSIINNKNETLYDQKWPIKIIANDIKKDRIIIIQINGKLRAEIKNPNLSKNPTEREIIDLSIDKLPKYLKNVKIKKVILIKDYIINIVI